MVFLGSLFKEEELLLGALHFGVINDALLHQNVVVVEKRVPGQNDVLPLTFVLHSPNSALALLSGPLTKHVSHDEVDATIGFNVEGSGEVGSNAQVLVYDVDSISGARASAVELLVNDVLQISQSFAFVQL